MQVEMATNEMKGERPRGGGWVDNRIVKRRSPSPRCGAVMTMLGFGC
jgi:hypothetical protein